jgi:nitroreductase
MSSSIIHDAISLPMPGNASETKVFSALRYRRTARSFASEPLPAQMLSNLLFAACGVNRPHGPFGVSGRTAASASNSQEIDVYVALPHACYLYNATDHRLTVAAEGDLRAAGMTPRQQGIETMPPAQLIYVADLERLEHTKGYQEPGLQDPEIQKSYYFVDTGLIAGNVYLFCAAEGLAAWFHNCDKAAIAKQLKLRPTQRALFAQSVGYPGLT